MTTRVDCPDEMVDRQRDDTLRPPAASVTSLNVASEMLPVALIEDRLAGDQQPGGQPVNLLRHNISGAEQLHALRADGHAGSHREYRGRQREQQRVAPDIGTQQTPDVRTRDGQ